MTLRDLDEEDISDDLAWNLVFSFKKDDNKNNVKVIKKALRDAKNNNFSEDITNMMKKDYVW